MQTAKAGKAVSTHAKIRLTALLNFLLSIHLDAQDAMLFASGASRAGIRQAPCGKYGAVATFSILCRESELQLGRPRWAEPRSAGGLACLEERRQ